MSDATDPVTSYPLRETLTQRFTLGTPRSFAVSPDGSRVLFLRSPSGVDKRHGLHVLDTATGQERCLVDPDDFAADEQLSTQERAARERSRTKSSGVVAFSCDAGVTVAVFVLSGALHVVDVAGGRITELPAAPAAIDPRIDPTGRRVAYVSDGVLRVVEVDGSADRVIAAPTDGERAHVTWGLAEFVAAEEMDRGRGFWWSPEGTRLLAARVDTEGVPVWYISDPGDPAAEPRTIAYPAAGKRNADVRLALFDVDAPGSDGRPVAWDHAAFPYLVSVHWSASGPPLLTVQSRDQRTQPILTVDTETAATSTRHTETDEHWVDVYSGVPAWTPSGALVHGGVRDGAYRLLVDGADVSGDGLNLRQVVSVGSDGVLFTASAEDPMQTHVYWLAHGEDTPTRLSESDGVHHGAVGGGVSVLAAWSLDHPGPRVRVRRDGREVAEIASLHEKPPFAPDVRLLTVGERSLRCAVLLPTGHTPGEPLPVIMEPYGGPHAQRVLHSNNAYVGHRWLAEQGFAVLVADGRGTPGRGPAWDRTVVDDLAGVTLADQVDALHAAAEQVPELDLGRVAIRGWSFGGYLSALAVLRRPDVFHAAIAGAPVIDWRLYDTFYTERYLGLPDERPEVYRDNSLLADAADLCRPLLLIHGLADDNVFAAHTLRLSAALLAAGRAHDVWPLTNVTHMLPADGDMAVNFPLLQLRWLRTALGVGVG